MRLTYNAQKFMAAIAAIAMFCFGPAMAAGTGLEKVYQACPGNKFAGDEIGKDKSKCYEKVTIYDVRVACLTLKKAGDGVSPVYKNALLTSKYNDVTASKDRCYNVSNGSFYSSSQSGDDPSTSESATCRDDFSKQTSGTFYKSETDSVTAKSDRPYCTNPTSGYFYGNPSDRPYIEYYNGCYAIGSASQLYGFADAVNNMTEGEICGTLVDNIVVNENVLTANGTLNGDSSSFTPWTPIKVMSGEKVTLNGNGKTISGLYFNNERNGYVGLFGEVKGTVSISELGIKDSYIKGFYYVGGLVGYNNVGGTLSVTNSYNAGIVTGKNNVGGLVGGSSATLTITNCYNVGTVSGDYYVGGFVGKNYDATLTITNSFFLGEGNNYGGTGKSADEFANGTVARLLHNYVQTGCKENCIDGTIWGQDVLNGDLLPNFSDKITGTLYDLVLHTFDDDNRSYPTYYLSEKGLELPTDLTRKNYVFLGWSAKETPGSSADIVTSIAKGETGTKTFYAQWMKVNEKGCYEIGTAFELYGFANVVNNATYGSQICGTLAENIVVNENVLKTNGALNGEGSNFTPWTLVNVQSGVQVTLNGNGKTISGLYFNDENRDNVGLFGEVYGTVSISNLGVKDSYFKGRNNVGGLVGCNGEKAKLTIENSYNSGTVSGSGDNVGGLVGYSYNGILTITNSYNAGPVSGSGNNVGGLVGISSGELSITNSYNSGTVSGSVSSICIGGLVGDSYNGTLTITNSYNAGAVTGENDVGGLVGENSVTLTITNSYNSGTVSGSGGNVGGLVGYNGGKYAKLTITNSFFLATDKSGDGLGGEAKALDDFYNGTVAFLLHNWCEMDGDNCKVGGLDGSVWGQDFTKENSLPDLSGKFVGGTPHTLTLHTFEGDTRKLPTIYLEGKVLKLPTDLTRENYVFLGWSAKETAGSSADIVTSIAKGETGKKEFYAQWMKVNEKGCYEIGMAFELYGFANVVNNATDGSQVCGTLTKDIVVNENVLTADGALNGVGSSFTPWTPMNVQSGVQVTLNGNGHTISGLYFNDGNTDKVGLFGEVNGTVSVSNLGLVDFYIRGGVSVGSFVASSRGKMTFANSYSAGVVNGGGNVGGFVGYHEDLLAIENCFSTTKLLYTGQTSGALIGVTSNATGLTITNSFFLATGGSGDELGGKAKSVDEFSNGSVALSLHDWCEMDGDECKEGGLNGLIWGQNVLNGDLLPNFSREINAVTQELVLRTFEGDTRKYPTEYIAGLELPTGLTREGFVFLGWSSKEVAESFSDIVTSIALDATGKKEFYAQWKELNADGCFEISSTFDLYAFANVVNNATNGSQVCGTLVDNIVVNTGVLNDGTLNGAGSSFTPWTPMTVVSGVQVTFNGNGKTISGLYFNDGNKDHVGLFGDVRGALSISDLGVKDSYFEGRENVGGLVGDNVGSLTITNSYNEGTVSGGVNNDVGGLVGYSSGTLDIANSYNEGTVSGCYYVGGLVGRSDAELTIENSYNVGFVSGLNYVGGLVGYSSGTLDITNSYNAGTVSGGGENVGGLVGDNVGSLTITNSYNAGTMSGGGKNVGGLVGYSSGTLDITNSFNSGTVTEEYDVGGLVGCNGGEKAKLTITNSYNAGTVSGHNDYVGGLVGRSDAELTIENSYNVGFVSGHDYVGGLVGRSDAELTIENSYNAGTVSSSHSVGGLVGYNRGKDAKLTITNSFFPGEGDNYGGTGKSAEEFHNGTVALLLHDWCEMDGDNCKEGGLNGSVWGQDFTKENSLPDLSGKFVGRTLRTLTLHTFTDDTRKLPTIYLEGLGLELPTDLTRENYIFSGWSAKETAESSADIVTSIAKDATGAKEFYAQWKELNADGCFEIASTVELYGFANVVNNATNGSKVCGTLVDNIVVNTGVLNDGTLNGVGSNFTPWTPMKVVSGVQVTLNGNGKTISGLYFNNEKDDLVGLFGGVYGTVSVSNLGVKDSYFKGRSNVGGLVGGNDGGSLSIENSYNSGTVSGDNYDVGGLVGYNGGENAKLTITNCYNVGTVSGTYVDVGGLVGSNSGELTITNSYNAGTLSGSGDFVGGLVGCNGGELTVTNSYNEGSVSGSGIFVGGLVGENFRTLTFTNSYNAGAVTGNAGVGGLVGENSGTLTITNSYNAGAVTENAGAVGGLVGFHHEGTLTIAHSFFLATGEYDVNYGGTETSLDDFHNGTVARNLHDWCEMEEGSETCKVGGKNGSVWGQDLNDANSLPDFSGKIGHKYGSVVFFYGEDDQVDSAHVDATSELAVDFPNDVVVSGPVKFKRTFAGLGYSTIMLPFTPNCTDDDCVKGVKFFEFNSYTDGEVQATEVSPKDLKANTPYLVQVAGASEIVFKNGGTFNTTTGDAYNPETDEYKVALTGDGAGWTIYGTYEYKTWEEGDAGLGRTYGFAANDGVNDESIVGKFAKIAAGAYIYPMRAYLEYDAPVALARPAANGEIRTVASLPDEIDVVIVDKDEKTGEQTTKVIGTINTRTGEFKFANDRWFDLQGRYLGVKKPTQKGAYYNNGKKVIVK